MGLAFGGVALKVGGGWPSQHQLADVLALYFGLLLEFRPCNIGTEAKTGPEGRGGAGVIE